MSVVGDLGEQQQIVASETPAGLPAALIKIEAGETDVIARAVGGVVFPERGLDRAEPDFMNRFVLRFWHKNFGVQFDHFSNRPVRGAKHMS